jgi:hypothetical protein
MLAYFLPAIIAFGIITSYEDIKIGKIRNRWIALALAYAAAAYALLILYYYLTSVINLHYIIELATNLLFAVAVGFGLWYAGVWTAGDGKLFIAFTALLPLSVFSLGYQPWIPSITLLTNTFVAALAVVLLFMLFQIRRTHLQAISIKKFIQPKQMAMSAAYLFAISWVISIVFRGLGWSTSSLSRGIITILVYALLSNSLKGHAFYLALLISLARFALDRSVYSYSFLWGLVVLILVWVVLRSLCFGLISNLGNEMLTKQTRASKLREGMLLAETLEKRKSLSKKELRSLKAQPGVQVIRNKSGYLVKKPKSLFQFGNFFREEAEGLTKEQIEKIKKVGVKQILVYDTIPLAPLLFLGVLITIIMNGNVLILIMNP